MPFVPAGTIAPGTVDSTGRDISGRPYGGYEVELQECALDGNVYVATDDGLKAHQATETHKRAAARR